MIPMTQTMKLPVQYAPLSQEEMTYTEGGEATVFTVLGGFATAVGVLVLGSSFVWGVGQCANWLSDPDNTDGNFFTVMGRAMDDIGYDMSQSPANFLRDSVSIATFVGVAAVPVGAVIALTNSNFF